MCDIKVRTLQPSQWRSYRDLSLRALEDSPAAFATTHSDARTRPDNEWAARLANLSTETDLPLVAEVRGVLAGILWAKIDSSTRDTAHLYQMWVAPEHRGHGAARKLLEIAIQWARLREAQSVALSVTCGDSSARRLYASAGFRAIGVPEPLRPKSELMQQNMVLEISTVAA